MLSAEECANIVRTCPDCYGRMVPFAIETDGICHNVDFMCRECGLGETRIYYVSRSNFDGNC